MMVQKKKKCLMCGEILPINHFYRRARGSSDGHQSYCKTCSNYRRKHPETWKTHHRPHHRGPSTLQPDPQCQESFSLSSPAGAVADPYKRLTIAIPKKVWQRVKVASVMADHSTDQILAQALDWYLPQLEELVKEGEQ